MGGEARAEARNPHEGGMGNDKARQLKAIMPVDREGDCAHCVTLLPRFSFLPPSYITDQTVTFLYNFMWGSGVSMIHKFTAPDPPKSSEQEAGPGPGFLVGSIVLEVESRGGGVTSTKETFPLGEMPRSQHSSHLSERKEGKC